MQPRSSTLFTRTGHVKDTSTPKKRTTRIPQASNAAATHLVDANYVSIEDGIKGITIENITRYNRDYEYSRLSSNFKLTKIQTVIDREASALGASAIIEKIYQNIIVPYFGDTYIKTDSYNMTQLDWLIIFYPEQAYILIKKSIEEGSTHFIDKRHIERLIFQYLASVTYGEQMQKLFASAVDREQRQIICNNLYQEIVKPYCQNNGSCTHTHTTTYDRDSEDKTKHRMQHHISSQLRFALYCQQPIEEIQALYQIQKEQSDIVQTHLDAIHKETGQSVYLSLNLYPPSYYTSLLEVAMQCKNAELALAYAMLLSPLADANKANALYHAVKNDHTEAAELLIEDYVANPSDHISATKTIDDVDIMTANIPLLSEKGSSKINTLFHLALEKDAISILNKLLLIPTVQQKVFMKDELPISYFAYAVATNKVAADFMVPHAKTAHFINLFDSIPFLHPEEFKNVCAFIKKNAAFMLNKAGEEYNAEKQENRSSLVQTLFCILLAKIHMHPFPTSFLNKTLISGKEVSSTMYKVCELAMDKESNSTTAKMFISPNRAIKLGGYYTPERAEEKLREIIELLKDASNPLTLTSVTSIFTPKPTGLTLEEELQQDIFTYQQIIFDSPHNNKRNASSAGVTTGQWTEAERKRGNKSPSGTL